MSVVDPTIVEFATRRGDKHLISFIWNPSLGFNRRSLHRTSATRESDMFKLRRSASPYRQPIESQALTSLSLPGCQQQTLTFGGMKQRPLFSSALASSLSREHADARVIFSTDGCNHVY